MTHYQQTYRDWQLRISNHMPGTNTVRRSLLSNIHVSNDVITHVILTLSFNFHPESSEWTRCTAEIETATASYITWLTSYLCYFGKSRDVVFQWLVAVSISAVHSVHCFKNYMICRHFEYVYFYFLEIMTSLLDDVTEVIYTKKISWASAGKQRRLRGVGCVNEQRSCKIIYIN